MSSYLQLFQDFLQKKESDVSRRQSAAASIEEEPEKETSTLDLPAKSDCNNINNITSNQMEHIWSHNTRQSNELTGLPPARTILVRRSPQCPCHLHPLEEHDLDDNNQAQIPTYNEISAKEAMNECARIANYVKNTNPDDEEWEPRVSQVGWTNVQKSLFQKVVRILDSDQLGRLSNVSRMHESIQRRCVVDKSAARLRKALASVKWDLRLAQWLHCLLMDHLPCTYMASYLDILQTLKLKVPTLIDKMLFGRPLNVSQELLAPVLKKRWEPSVITKSRKLENNDVIVSLPPFPTCGPVPHRLQKWYQHLATITQIVQITLPMRSEHIGRQSLEQLAEQIVSLTRVKIQELRNENSTRSIILLGFEAGAALALQVALSEHITCVICMGFSYNTMNGVRGSPDDRILDIKVPILFIIGQCSQRTSTEEIESLREKMQSETSLVVVGGADDMLRVSRRRRCIENVTQLMVDTMVTDEIYDFIKKIQADPPGPRQPNIVTNVIYPKLAKVSHAGDTGNIKVQTLQRKRKNDAPVEGEQTVPKTRIISNIGRPRTRPLPTAVVSVTKPAIQQPQTGISAPIAKSTPIKTKQLSPGTLTNEDLNLAIQSILSDSSDHEIAANASSGANESPPKPVTNFEIVAQTKPTSIRTNIVHPLQKQGAAVSNSKIKMIPSNQFIQLKPPMQTQSKIYTIKSALNQVAGSSSSIGSIVKTSPNVPQVGQQQIFTLKSPNGQTTQYVTAAPPTAQQKYTVVKNASGGTTLQLTTPTTSGVALKPTSGGSNVDLSNIIDMPIVFADNDGNLTDSMTSGSSATTTNTQQLTKQAVTTKPTMGQLIISQKIIKEGVSIPGSSSSMSIQSMKSPFIISKPQSTTIFTAGGETQTSNRKLVYIDRSTIKSTNIITRPSVTQQLQKLTKVVVTNSKVNPTIINRQNPQVSNSTPISTTQFAAVKPMNIQTLKTASKSVLNMNTKSLPSVNLIKPLTNPTGTGNDNQTTIRKNIMVNRGGLKQIPEHLKTQLLNRNLTVRKLIHMPNIKTVSTDGTTTQLISSTSSATSMQQDGAITTVASIQSVPKIITLNPINPLAGSSVASGSDSQTSD